MELDDALGAVLVAQDQERAAQALRVDALAQLGRRGAVGLQR
jgi:hypothetical protein